MVVKQRSLEFVGFLQAAGLVAYCSLVAFVMSHAEKWFGKLPEEIVAPVIFLTLFATSALICTLIVGTYPFLLWQKKRTSEALRVVLFTVAWLIGIVIFLFYLIASSAPR